jgi:ubiquinone biosynthesis UbiH/UbiF/VisC/COQ6 family hydroxylase
MSTRSTPAVAAESIGRDVLPWSAPQVAVVGTGVVGLAAALGCAQAGLSVALIGPAPQFPAGSGTGATASAADAPDAPFDARIYAIAPAARELLLAQRVWSQVPGARTCAVTRMEVFGDDGGRLRFDARAAGVENLATICEESRLQRALWLGCSMAPGIRVHGSGFQAADFSAGQVHVNLQDGSALDCTLLLGADGKASAVRAAAGIGARSDSYGQTALVANLRCAWPHHGVAYQWFTGDEGVVALLPLPGERVSLVWSAPTALAAELAALDDAQFAARLGRRTRFLLGELAPLGPRHAFELNRIIVERLVRPGVALLGDAAHVVHPLAGQGLNLGLQDVADFLRLLQAREPWRPLGDMVWLRRYERARAEPIALMRGTVGALARLFGSPDRRVRRLRTVGLSAVDALAPLKHALVRHAMG